MAKTFLGKIIEAIKKANTVIETTESILPAPKETKLKTRKKTSK